MKSLTVIAALALGLAAQAAVAQPTQQVSPGVAPQLAHKYMPRYDIVTAKVAEGVKFANAAPTKGFNPQANPAGWTVFQALPSRLPQ
jgi:opacity protein-like surface antigen